MKVAIIKRYIVLFAFTAAVISWLSIVPKLSVIAVDGVDVYVAFCSPHQSAIQGTGSFFASNQADFSYGYAVKPSKVYVDIGDKVEKGQKLMDIDTEQTAQAFKSALGSAPENSSQTASTSTGASGGIDGLLNQYFGSSSLPSGLENKIGEYDASGGTEKGASIPAGGLPDIPQSIFSSVAGVVTELCTSDGAFVPPQTPLAVVSDLGSLQVKAQFDEGMAKQLKEGQTAIVSGNAFKEVYHGKVIKVYPAARAALTATGSRVVVDAIISLDKPDGKIMPGFSANVSVITAVKENAIYLPYEAIMQDDKNQEYVYVVKNGRIARRNIITGAESENGAEVLSGVSAGEKVVFNPSGQLKNGQLVKILARYGGSDA